MPDAADFGVRVEVAASVAFDALYRDHPAAQRQIAADISDRSNTGGDFCVAQGPDAPVSGRWTLTRGKSKGGLWQRCIAGY